MNKLVGACRRSGASRCRGQAATVREALASFTAASKGIGITCPAAGIVSASRGTLELGCRPSSKRFLACTREPRGRPGQGAASLRARTQACAPHSQHHTTVPVISKQCLTSEPCTDSGGALAALSHLDTAEPGHREHASLARFEADVWQQRHCQGRAKCPKGPTTSWPPKATGISSRCGLALVVLLSIFLRDPTGADSESRRDCGPEAFAASVTPATHQAMAITCSSWSAVALRTL